VNVLKAPAIRQEIIDCPNAEQACARLTRV